MKKILHLEENPIIRKRIKDILRNTDHQVTSVNTIEDAEEAGEQNLYICGELNQYSDGLGFATEQLVRGRKALIVAPRRKFSRIPYVSTYALNNGAKVRELIETLLAGD